jgi:hypothetical protein
MATETAVPFTGSPVTTSQQYRDRYRPTQPDMVDDAYGGGQLAVTNPSGKTFNVANGGGVVQAARYDLTSGPLVLTAATNVGGGAARSDIICLTYDSSHTPGVYGRIVQGTAGSGLPATTNSLTGVWDFPIAHYTISTSDVISGLTDRRIFSDGNGGTLTADNAAGTLGVGYFAPAPRVGQLQTFWPSGAQYRWDGSAWTLVDTGGWRSFTPTWTTSGTAPALGNGTLTGRYQQRGKTVHFRIELTAGTTTTFGTGNWSFTVPNTPDTVVSQTANVRAIDVSAGLAYTGQGTLFGSTTTIPQTATGASGALQTITNTVPMTWASTDSLRIWGSYQAA